jgi:hypothetical protein
MPSGPNNRSPRNRARLLRRAGYEAKSSTGSSRPSRPSSTSSSAASAVTGLVIDENPKDRVPIDRHPGLEIEVPPEAQVRLLAPSQRPHQTGQLVPVGVPAHVFVELAKPITVQSQHSAITSLPTCAGANSHRPSRKITRMAAPKTQHCMSCRD